jgi:YfiH family protein
MSIPAVGWLTPDWPAPIGVRALTTLRAGGGSAPPFDGLNLATHVGDDAAQVQRNRAALRVQAGLPSEPLWLNQVHGTHVVAAGAAAATPPTADACVAHATRQVCAILTADCLPVLFCDVAGTCVGAAHAGWRGLVQGILPATIAALQRPGTELLAWLGPAIEQSAFEVGDEVREQFLGRAPESASAFVRNHRQRWQADLYALARQELARAGVTRVSGGGFACYADRARFFSYRREARTGRMATLIWLEPPGAHC